MVVRVVKPSKTESAQRAGCVVGHVSAIVPNEIFVGILRNVHEMRSKVKLESLSKSCQELVREHCWKNVKELSVDLFVQPISRAFGYLVNGEFCSQKNISQVIQIFETRGKWIRKVSFGVDGFLSVGKPSPINRVYESLTDREFLARMSGLTIQGSFVKSNLLGEFMSVRNFRFGLTTLSLRWPDKLKEDDSYQLWVSIGQMIHLETLRLEGSSLDKETSDYDLVKALRGKPLKVLHLHPMRHVSGDGLADALRLCDTLHSLKFTFSANFLWESFVDNMDTDFFAELTEITCSFPPNDYSFAAAFGLLPENCPKLRICRVGYSVPEISPNMLTAFVESFFSEEVCSHHLRVEMDSASEEDIPDFFLIRDNLTRLYRKIQCSVEVKQDRKDVSEVTYNISLDHRCVTVVFLLKK